jgi:Cu(I)/Ag(I) efflux system membrane fusion protein
MPAEITLPYLPGRRFAGQVAFVYPSVSPDTRTARVRIELPNPDFALRPDMWATVQLESAAGERLVVPLSAVLHAGQRSFVFLDLGEGRFRPQPVEVGLRVGEEVEILAGLEAGQAVVASGTFLIASESRLRAALEQW